MLLLLLLNISLIKQKINPFIHTLSSIKFTYAGFVCLKIIVQGMELKVGVVELP